MSHIEQECLKVHAAQRIIDRESRWYMQPMGRFTEYNMDHWRILEGECASFLLCMQIFCTPFLVACPSPF